MARPVAENPKRQTLTTNRQDLHLYLHPEVRRAVRVYAAQHDMTVSDLMEAAAREYLERHADQTE